MGDDGQAGRKAQMDITQECRGDQHTVDKVVGAFPQNDQSTRRMMTMRVFIPPRSPVTDVKVTSKQHFFGNHRTPLSVLRSRRRNTSGPQARCRPRKSPRPDIPADIRCSRCTRPRRSRESLALPGSSPRQTRTPFDTAFGHAMSHELPPSFRLGSLIGVPRLRRYITPYTSAPGPKGFWSPRCPHADTRAERSGCDR
jgi:hypothetical protein